MINLKLKQDTESYRKLQKFFDIVRMPEGHRLENLIRTYERLEYL